MPKIPYDPDTSVVEEHFAVVYAPRRSRDRFSEGAVVLKQSAEQALQDSDSEKKHFAAVVAGPTRITMSLINRARPCNSSSRDPRGMASLTGQY